jgi:type VI secretion system lysozyme-like protein
MAIPPRKKWESLGGAVPLFERLIDLEPDVPAESKPLSMYNKDELIGSVIKEASYLLNTRCKIPYKDYERMDVASLSYGVPQLYGLFDASYADPSKTEDRLKLCRFIANALRIFDPRLDNVSVIIDRYDQLTQRAHLTITADLKMGNIVEAVSFPVEMG